MGIPFPSAASQPITKPGYWNIYFLAPKSPEYNFFNAPAREWLYYPNGRKKGEPMVLVTYNLTGISGDVKTWSDYENVRKASAEYSPDVGYRIFHLTYDLN
jgi:hypothetical protein